MGLMVAVAFNEGAAPIIVLLGSLTDGAAPNWVRLGSEGIACVLFGSFISYARQSGSKLAHLKVSLRSRRFIHDPPIAGAHVDFHVIHARKQLFQFILRIVVFENLVLYALLVLAHAIGVGVA